MKQIVSQIAFPSHQIYLVTADSLKPAIRNIYFKSPLGLAFFKRTGLVHLYLYDSVLVDSLPLTRISFTGKCRFRKSKWDTLTVSELKNSKMTLVLSAFDSSGKFRYTDTIEIKNISFNKQVNKLNSLNPFGNSSREFGFGAEVKNETRYSTITYPGQGIPAFYSRTGMNINAEAAGIPIRISYFATTENGRYQDINNFKVSVNIPQLKENLREKAKKKYTYNLDKTKSNLKAGNFSANYKPNYQVPDSLVKRPALPAIPDTGISMPTGLIKVSNPGSGIKDSLLNKQSGFVSKQKSRISNLPTASDYAIHPVDSLKKRVPLLPEVNYPALKRNLFNRQTPAKLIAGRNPQSMAMAEADKLNLDKLLGGLTRLDAGKFALSVSPLWLNDISVKGAALGYKIGKAEVNLVAGNTKVLAGSTLSQKRRFISGGYIDYFPVPALKLGIGYLYGKESSNDVFYSGSGQLLNFPQKNHVLVTSVDFIWKNQEVNLGIARSTLSDVNATVSTESSSKKNGFQSLLPGSNAIFNYHVSFRSTGTDITTQLRKTNHYFESFGLNYLRKDFRSWDTKITQQFLKYFSVFGLYKYSDNKGSPTAGYLFRNSVKGTGISAGFKGVVKKVSLTGIQNEFYFSGNPDTSTLRTQQMITALTLLQFKLTKSIRFSSVFSVTAIRFPEIPTNRFLFQGVSSNTLLIGKSATTCEYTFSEVSDSLKIEQIQISESYSFKRVSFTAGADYSLLNGKPGSAGAFGMASCNFKRIGFNLRFDHKGRIAADRSDSEFWLPATGYTVTLTSIFRL